MSILALPTSTFTANLALALAQTTSKLAHLAIQQPASGELQQINNLVQPRRARRKTARFEPITHTSGDYVKRWAPIDDPYYFEETVDKFDEMKTLIDIQGGATMSSAGTLQRAKDEAFLRGFYGPNYTGKAGSTIVTFAAGNIIPVNEGAAAATGMNVDKLRAAQKVLRENHVDLEAEECFMALSADQIADLQAEIEMTNADFNRTDSPVLRDGKLSRLLGFNFVACQFGDAESFGDEVAALTLDPSGYRRVPFWTRSGMAMATWEEQFSRVSELAGNHYAIQIYARNCQTGTRTDEKKCGQVLCLEA
jgi:hypothetical protein